MSYWLIEMCLFYAQNYLMFRLEDFLLGEHSVSGVPINFTYKTYWRYSFEEKYSTQVYIYK